MTFDLTNECGGPGLIRGGVESFFNVEAENNVLLHILDYHIFKSYMNVGEDF